MSELWDLASNHALIGDVRGRGLFIGVDFVSDRDQRTAATTQASLICSRLKVYLKSYVYLLLVSLLRHARARTC